MKNFFWAQLPKAKSYNWLQFAIFQPEKSHLFSHCYIMGAVLRSGRNLNRNPFFVVDVVVVVVVGLLVDNLTTLIAETSLIHSVMGLFCFDCEILGFEAFAFIH